jgi:hypothetical protein
MGYSERQVEDAAAQVKLARYLLTLADTHGLTHGEKHYIMRTVMHLLKLAETTLDTSPYSTTSIEQNSLSTSDIPF